MSMLKFVYQTGVETGVHLKGKNTGLHCDHEETKNRWEMNLGLIIVHQKRPAVNLSIAAKPRLDGEPDWIEILSGFAKAMASKRAITMDLILIGVIG